jgi:phage terminase large subunit
LEFTHVVIEEVGEVPEKAVDVLTSRKDRFMNAEYGIVGKTVMTCNPTQNFIRKLFYEVYMHLGGGKFQVWESGMVELPDKRVVPAKSAFVRSLAADNPFLPRNYIENLKTKPRPIRRRLLHGDWNYADDKDLLMRSSLLDRAMTGLRPNIDNPPKGVGADIADKGDDHTILSYVENFVLMEQEEVEIDMKPIGEQIALAIIRFAQERGVTAKNVAFDCVGVGASTRDQLLQRGWDCIQYNAGSSATEDGYKNFGSQQAWGMREDMDADKFKVHRDLKTLEEWRTEALAHPYDEDPVIWVRKDKAKEELGHSPDYFDSSVMARHACLAGTSADYGIIW